MAEPGTVAGTVAQTNAQGLYSNSHYAGFSVSSNGNDTIQGSIPSRGVGFNNSGVVDSKEGTGMTGEHDEVTGEEFEGQQSTMGKQLFGMDNLPESPYYTYHTRELSSGKGQSVHKYHGERSLGRGMNMHNIRSRHYYSEGESDIFTWNLNAMDPNTNKSEIEKQELETIRDV